MKSALAASLLALAAHAATLGVGDASGAWVQLVPAGKFTGRDGRGPYDSGDKVAMGAIVATTLKLAGSTELVIDYDHQSVWAAVPGVGGTAKAAGWIKEMQVRDDGIWGRVEWTANAAAAIRAGEYRYLSPVFAHDKTGRIIAIRMAGLINTPNLDLAEVAAGALFNFDPSSKGDPMDKILTALGLAAGSGEDVVLAAIHAMQTSSTAIARAAGLTETAKPAEILTAVNSAFADRARLATAAGLKADAKPDDIVIAVQSAVAGGAPDPAKFVPIAGFTEMQAQLKALVDGTSAKDAETAVNKAIEDGKLIPSMRTWGLSLHKSDAKAFEDYVDGAPKLVGSQMTQTKREGVAATLTDTDMLVAEAMGIDHAAMAKTAAAIAKEIV